MQKEKDRKAQEEAEDRIDVEEAREALADAKKNGTVSWEKIKAEFNL